MLPGNGAERQRFTPRCQRMNPPVRPLYAHRGQGARWRADSGAARRLETIPCIKDCSPPIQAFGVSCGRSFTAIRTVALPRCSVHANNGHAFYSGTERVLNYGDLISVVVPVYNRAHILHRSVGSLCNQSYRNLEILVVDDCSTDDIEGAVKALDDPRVRLIRREKNGGAAAARNTGVAAATSDLLAFMDSDDVSLFDRFDQEMKLFCTLPEDYIGVYAAAVAHTDTDEAHRGQAAARVLPPVHRTPLSGDLSAATRQGNFIDMPTMLLKKSAVLAAGPFDERLRNNVDWDFTLRLTRQGKFGFVPQPLYIFSYAPRKASGNDHVSHNPRYSVLSYCYITGKLRRAGHDGPEMAGHYAAAGSYLMRLDRPAFARRYFRAALKITPGNPRLWAHLALSRVPALHRWSRGRSTRHH